MEALSRTSILKHVRTALVLIPLAAFAACGIGESQDDSVQAKNQRDNEKLAGSYATVTGTYSGTIIFGGSEEALPAQLQMYMVTVQDGVDPNNAPKSRVVLRGQLKMLGVGELDDTNFFVDYNALNGNVSLQQQGGATSGGGSSPGAPGGGSGTTVSTCQVGPKDPALSVLGTILNGEFKNATVNGSNGAIGSLNMVRINSDDRQPVRDQRQRLLKAYTKIVGTYGGELSSNGRDPNTGNPTVRTADSELIIRILENPIAAGDSCPSLVGQYKFTKIVGKLDDMLVSISYRETTNDIFIKATGSANAGRACVIGPADVNLAIDGRIVNRRLTGVMKGSEGTVGNVKLDWINENTEQANDQYERLDSAYAEVAGTYAGRFDDANKDGRDYDFPVRFTIIKYENESSQYVPCPALRAQYIRPDKQDNIGTILLMADYLPYNQQLSLRSNQAEGSGPGAGQPGHKQFTLSARVQRNGFSGQMDWWDRTGIAKVVKCRGNKVDERGNCQ